MKSMRKIRMLLVSLFICLLVGSNVCYAAGETGPRKIGGSSVSVSYNPASSSSDYSVSADPKRASRPAIYGDIYTITYKTGYYNFNTKKWSRTPSTKTRKEIRNTYVKVRYK